MTPDRPTDSALAVHQGALRHTHSQLGHEVHLFDPVPGLVDIVFRANGGFAVGCTAFVASFAAAEPARGPDREEISLRLIDPRFDHLDVARPGLDSRAPSDPARVYLPQGFRRAK